MKNVICFLSLFCGWLVSAQSTKEIVPPAEVSAAFEKEFLKVKPVWASEFTGEDSDEIRYEATFSRDNIRNMAAYDKLGNLKAIETEIALNQLPGDAFHYLRSHTYEKNIVEIAQVTDSNKTITYEIGIQKDDRFFDLVFDRGGSFVKRVEKD